MVQLLTPLTENSLFQVTLNPANCIMCSVALSIRSAQFKMVPGQILPLLDRVALGLGRSELEQVDVGVRVKVANRVEPCGQTEELEELRQRVLDPPSATTVPVGLPVSQDRCHGSSQPLISPSWFCFSRATSKTQ
ncbi:hypothetical protein V6N13_139880 [Hibiscus sabdariffa]